MKRKTAILTIAYLCAALALLGVYAALQRGDALDARRASRYAGEHAFEELCAAVGALDTTLQKCALAASPGLQAALCADAYAQSLSGTTALGQLDLASHELENTAAFLGRTGDFTRALARAAATGAAWSAAERADLVSLAGVAAWATGELEALRGEIADGLCCALDAPDALRELESAFPPVPESVYDGKYTAARPESAMLTGKAETSEKEACMIAASFLGQNARTAACAGRGEGEGAAWRVQLGETSVLVSGRGGQVLRAVCARAVGEPVLGEDAARAETEKFLRSRGYVSLRETAHALEGGCLVTEWCFVQNGVVCYPDTLRVSLALDTGELAAFEAEDYVTRHRTRALDTAQTVSWEAAEALLAPGLTVEERGYALLLSAGGEERLCLSFRCRDAEGRGALIFSSAATGSQERIALLREDESGLRTV